MKLFVKTHFGLEKVLKEEIISLGGTKVEMGNRSVQCEGEKELLYRLNYNLRTALKVFFPVYHFRARREEELYKKVSQFDWSQIFGLHQTFAIDHTIFSEHFRHGKYVSLKMKDAIADQFRAATGSRPSVDTEDPDIRFNIHGNRDQFTISLDSSGKSLNQRGYRVEGHQAPVNEALAAGMLLLAGWTKNIPLLDPMCGSGTLLIEAAMIAQGIPPQYLRGDFGFKKWKDFDSGLWNNVKTESNSTVRRSPLSIVGGDVDPKAVKMTQQALKKLGIERFVEVKKRKFQDWLPPFESGMIITNPPYGERIGSDIEQLYSELGDSLTTRFAGYCAWILSSNRDALQKLLLKPDDTHKLYNGPLQCEYCKYDLHQDQKN